MEITIGGKAYRTRKPSDLDKALLGTTGCSAAEIASHLGGWPSAGRIASALHPFLPDDAPSAPELAQAIAASEDGPKILVAVKKLYAADEETATAAPATASKPSKTE
ncbi:hypothetical protein NZL82_13990 [Sphingomonas sanguinis]|uniref:hypothetical protein n=1 Tax=Sphingomonas sp. LC-1 TaxID=3110957 RepID=UPI0021BAC575|nr:hypothetical protein [Sphingomonas sp. LC-1]MCT8002987.1 hypothetical protein [Sphingomonas sp. LC-1]